MGLSTLLLPASKNFGLILVCHDVAIEALAQFQVSKFYFI
jgi:hypothetical protein